MTDDEVRRWSEAREWTGQFALAWRPEVPLENHRLVWHECHGPDDPDCGNCRFSAHGCNGSGPSRARYLEWWLGGGLSGGPKSPP